MARSAPPAPSAAPALSAIVVAGTHSGVGKTTVTLGLIAALRRRGLRVQPFKVGPDFIDPLHHARASGRRPRNLDGWMLSPEVNRATFARATADADAAILEGVMGLYDGSEGGSDRGSTAEMAKLLGLPVVLVLDASAMARSAAALIHGFTDFDRELHVAGVVLNRVGGAGHAQLIREAVGDAVPVLGAIPQTSDLVVPERHLGLHLPHEARTEYVERAADLVSEHLDLELLLAVGRVERMVVRSNRESSSRAAPARVRIALARDEAFCFYYEENLELLADAGAELVEFSPIRDPLPARVDGLYIGGGYPELHAAELAANEDTRSAIRRFAASGRPVYAECGGLMYLAHELCIEDARHPMCGVLPFSAVFPAGLTLAYVEVTTTAGCSAATALRAAISTTIRRSPAIRRLGAHTASHPHVATASKRGIRPATSLPATPTCTSPATRAWQLRSLAPVPSSWTRLHRVVSAIPPEAEQPSGPRIATSRARR